MGVNAVGARYFRRTDGIVGVGFFIEFAGLRQASISWPDRVSSRHTEDEFTRGTIVDVTDAMDPRPELPTLEPVAEPGPADEIDEPDESNPPEPVEPPLDVPVEPVDEIPKKSEAEHIREYITANPEASNAQVIEHLATISVDVTSSQIAYQRKKLASK